MFIIYDPEKHCIVEHSIRRLEEARRRARAWRDAGREVILRAIPQAPIKTPPNDLNELIDEADFSMGRIYLE